jgi:hypothetical protein
MTVWAKYIYNDCVSKIYLQWLCEQNTYSMWAKYIHWLCEQNIFTVTVWAKYIYTDCVSKIYILCEENIYTDCVSKTYILTVWAKRTHWMCEQNIYTVWAKYIQWLCEQNIYNDCVSKIHNFWALTFYSTTGSTLVQICAWIKCQYYARTFVRNVHVCHNAAVGALTTLADYSL